MGDFFGGGGPEPLIAAGLDIQTSTNILPIPIGWGTNLLPGNLTWADKFEANDPQGGKGGGGKSGQKDYSADLMITLCQGITSGLPLAYEGSQIHYDDYHSSWLASIGATMFFGSSPDQAPWSEWSGSYAYAALSYPGMSYIAVPSFQLGSSPTPPNFNYLVQFDPACFAAYSKVGVGEVDPPNTLYVPTGGDPALVINDLFNGDVNLGRGFPGFALDKRTVLTAFAPIPSQDSTFQTYCWANSIDFSPVLRTASKATGIIDKWMQILNSEFGCWDGLGKVIPRGDTVQSGNGVTFTPNVTPIWNLGPDDFITDDTDLPVKIDRRAPEECFNVVRLEVMNPVNEWSPLPVEARSEPDFLQAGNILRVMPQIAAHEITDPINVAPLLAYLILQRQQLIRNTFTFRLSQGLGTLLTPMDLLILTDPASELDGYVVRVKELNADEKGIITVVCEDFPQGAATAALYATQQTLSVSTDTGQAPGSVNVPVIFEPPSTLYDPAQLVFALSGGYGDEANPNWGSCQVWGSVGGASYQRLGATTGGPAAQGTLTATLPTFVGTNPDLANTIAVDLNESGRALASFPSAAAAAGSSVCYVDGELIGYTTATLATITIASSEKRIVPQTPGPFTITVNFAGTWLADIGVSYTGGAALTYTAGTPVTGQYTHNGSGLYSFAAGDARAAVTISYSRHAPGYNLTGLYRGLYGTTIGAHAPGTAFALIDGDPAIFKIAVPPGYIGQTVLFKFPSLNIFGTALEDISTVPAYSYAVKGSGTGGGTAGVPLAPTGLAATGGAFQNTLSWNANAPSDNVTLYQVYAAPGHLVGFGSTVLIGAVNGLSFVHTALPAGTEYTYYLVAVNAAGASLPEGPVDATTLTGQLAFQLRGNLAGKPGVAQELFVVEMLGTEAFPASLTGSRGGCEVAPTGNIACALTKIVAGTPTSIGTMNIAAGATAATFTFASSVGFGAGDLLKFVAPATPDATLAGLYYSFNGTR